MLGIKYICDLYNVNPTDLSRELEVTRANFYNWIKGIRKIPKKYLPVLSKKFDIPEKYFQKELTDIDELNIKKIKLNKEIDKMDDENKDISKNEKLRFDVEMKIMNLKLSEAMKCISDNIKGIENREFNEIEDITYALKTFFDVYNSEESYFIGFSDILHSIANYLDIEGYRDEDNDKDDDGIKRTYLIPEFNKVANEKREIFKKRLFELLDYRKDVEKEFQRGIKEFMRENK